MQTDLSLFLSSQVICSPYRRDARIEGVNPWEKAASVTLKSRYDVGEKLMTPHIFVSSPEPVVVPSIIPIRDQSRTRLQKFISYRDKKSSTQFSPGYCLAVVFGLRALDHQALPPAGACKFQLHVNPILSWHKSCLMSHEKVISSFDCLFTNV